MNRTTLVETGVLLGAFLPTASSSAATKARPTVTPGGVMAGDPVKVDGTTPGVSKPKSQVLVYSSALRARLSTTASRVCS